MSHPASSLPVPEGREGIARELSKSIFSHNIYSNKCTTIKRQLTEDYYIFYCYICICWNKYCELGYSIEDTFKYIFCLPLQPFFFLFFMFQRVEASAAPDTHKIPRFYPVMPQSHHLRPAPISCCLPHALDRLVCTIKTRSRLSNGPSRIRLLHKTYSITL